MFRPVAALAALALALPAAAQEAPPPPPASAPAPASETMQVYGAALGPGWENWSWGKTELGVELNGSARRPIRAELAGYQAIYLHHAPFSTAPYKYLGMLLHGLATGGQKLRIIAIVGGKPIEGKVKNVTLAPNGWTKVEVPLATLGAANATIDGFWIQNDTDQPLPYFYAAEIMLH